MDLVQLVNRIEALGLIERLKDNPASQFGIQPEQFLGASILPEKTVEGNRVEDEAARYRPVVANDGGRYSPVQIKEGAALFAQFEAKLAESDIGKQFTGQQYDDLRKFLGRGGSFDTAASNFLGWLDKEVNQALLRKNELYRWQAIVDAQVDRLGDNSYAETVVYPNPSGHRRQVAADWDAVSSGVSTNDPMSDLRGIARDARVKNIRLVRAIMSSDTQYRLLDNTKFQDRAQYGAQGFIPPNDSILRGEPSAQDVANVFRRNGLPAPELFDETYEDADGTHRYLHENKIIFIGATGRTQEIKPQEGDVFYAENTLGYLGVGTTQGEDTPGRIITNRVYNDDKPYRIESKAWQTSLPVILSPEKLYVLDTTAP